MLHLFPDQRAPWHTLPAQKMKQARSKNRQKTVSRGRRCAAKCTPGVLSKEWASRLRQSLKAPRLSTPSKEGAEARGCRGVGSSFVELADEGSSFIFHPFLRPSEKRGGLYRLSRPPQVSRAKGRQRGAGKLTEGFIIVHDKTLKMNMRKVK